MKNLTDLTWTGLGLKPGLGVERPANECLRVKTHIQRGGAERPAACD